MGKKYITPSIADKPASFIEKKYDECVHEQLSDREYEVMCLLAKGIKKNDIAKEFDIVKTYQKRILEKMNMENVVEMTYYAVKNGLVD